MVLPLAPCFCFLLALFEEVLLSVAPVCVLELVVPVACGVFCVSSVRVEPDVDGVDVCAARMETENDNAATVVSSFFIVHLLVKDRFLPTVTKMPRCSGGLTANSANRLTHNGLWEGN